MMLEWFSAREATELGIRLADQLSAQTAPRSAEPGKRLQQLLHDADRDPRTPRLNMFKRAKLANTFKGRLLQQGIDKQIVDEVTRQLILHLSLQGWRGAAPLSAAAANAQPEPTTPKMLLLQGRQCIERGDFVQAAAVYRELLDREPRHIEALHHLGVALLRSGDYAEAEAQIRKAIEIEPNFDEAYATLGMLLLSLGKAAESEQTLRRGLKLNPKNAAVRASLGATLLVRGEVREAKSKFEKALKLAPDNVSALLGSADIAKIEGRFEDAAAIYGRVLELQPKMPRAWASLAGLGKMTAADSDWLHTAQEIAASGIAPLEESDLRFAIGKYFDDIKDYPRAFENFQRANELRKTAVSRYVPDVRTHFVDRLIRSFTRASIAQSLGGSASEKPVFIVGMIRSGTSLAEQIIASHPAVHGAGELLFWTDAAQRHEAAIDRDTLDEPMRKKLAEDYLRLLATLGADAPRVVDKAPFNSDFLGFIHTVFPKARFIYMQRDPVDACLSCYFQQFSTALNFTLDMSDLAHYYGEHKRLMAHWRSVLPEGTMLEVPYEQLVADPNLWMRKILAFIGLEWNDSCLDFEKTQRLVATASYWQVRQRIYKSSVARWRNYEKFVGPLLKLRA